MKLYTEEQVRKLLKKAFWQDLYEDDSENSLMNSLTPIELPNDEEIYLMSEAKSEHSLYNMGFKYGAKWMRDKILNK